MENGSTVVAINDMTFRWRADGPEILDIPDLHIVRGERVFIKGESGSGKSTLLSLLGGVNLPQQGKVSILGREMNAMSGAIGSGPIMWGSCFRCSICCPT